MIVGLRDQLGEEHWNNILSGPQSTTMTYFERVCHEKNINDEMIFLLGFQLGMLQIIKARRRNGNLVT